MPELPEAETLVRGIRPAITGERIRRVEVLRADILRQPKRRVADRARNRQVLGVGRRGKNVLIELDGDWVIWVNLGMTGGLLPFATPPRGARRPTHPAVRFRFHSGGLLVFDDTRRFGTVEVLSAEERVARSAAMGPEPLSRSFTTRRLHAALQGSRSPMRSWLLDQRRIAGVGNIYAAEALFLAGVHPQRPANTVSREEADALRVGLKKVLRGAIDHGGTTIRDYRNAEGEAGRYARSLHVYGRDGEPCGTCATEVRRVVFSGRSAFYCPHCQPYGKGGV